MDKVRYILPDVRERQFSWDDLGILYAQMIAVETN